MKTKLLLYCTKRKPYLFNRIIKGESDGYYTDIVPYDIEDEYLCGKIVAECECEVEEITYYPKKPYDRYGTPYRANYDLLFDSCLEYDELDNYLNKQNGYALHLSNIKTFEKPLELSEVEYMKKYKNCSCCPYCMDAGEMFLCNTCEEIKPLTNSPQNMCHCYYNGEHYVLISIHPEWLCKILNGEKTIEVRRKILKEML